MGKIVAPEGCSIRLRSTVRPTLAGFSVAPMTATVLGWKIGASGLGGQKGTVDSWPRWSGAVPGKVGIWSIRLLLIGPDYFPLKDPAYQPQKTKDVRNLTSLEKVLLQMRYGFNFSTLRNFIPRNLPASVKSNPKIACASGAQLAHGSWSE
jgi:hypothetical protein